MSRFVLPLAFAERRLTGTLGLLFLAALGGCGGGQTAPPVGGLVLTVETDLALPQDIDRIHVEVSQFGQVLLSEDHEVGPDKLRVPAEFRVPPVGNSMPVTARGVAYKNGEARIERSAVTPIPTLYLGRLRLPLNYLCDGTATREGTSTCGDARTCKQGTCRPSQVAPADVPPYESGPGAADAGGNVGIQTVGDCFDVLACFAAATAAVVEEVTCSIALPPESDPARLNLAIQLPVGSAGICDQKGCWVVLDRGGDGWTLEGTRLRLPESLCQPRADGRKLAVALTTACGSKMVAVPPCGPWSIATTPIESPPPPPLLGEACAGPMTQPCGNCGTQSRQCQNGQWSAWSTCGAEGECAPAAAQECGMSGRQLCGGDCRWGACTGQVCSGPPAQSCGNCGTQTRTCGNGTWSEWSACAGEGACAPDTTRACEGNGTQSCGGNCQWSACGHRTCPGPASRACGNCGIQTRICDPASGTWSEWSACAGEGACAPNATMPCASGGFRTCGGSCQWTATCAGQTCAGAPVGVCGNCGMRSRACDTSTGTWSDWSTCSGEGGCAPGASRACGTDGTETCGPACQWGPCENQRCEGAASEKCGNCGTRARTCQNGVWSDWTPCTGEGACAANAAQTCGSGGQRACSTACQWGPCFEACAISNGGCDPLTTCTNAGTGRLCGPCPAGFSGTGATGCVDLDECATGNGGCDPLTTCTNTRGGRTCGPCPMGYLNLGAMGVSMCVDVDECATANGGCDPLTVCSNTPGGFTCGSCPMGYLSEGNACVDVDECAANNGGCDPLTACTNIPGSRTCGSCPPGYDGTGASGCVDVDECAVSNGGCDPLAACMNLPGGRLCGPCPPGYGGNGETGCVAPAVVGFVSNQHNAEVRKVDLATGAVLGGFANLYPSPFELAISSDASTLYVTHARAPGAVTIIDTTTGSAQQVAVGSTPIEIALLPDGSKLYTADWFGQGVSVVDTTSKALVATIPIAQLTYDVAAAPNGARVYATSLRSENLFVIDTTLDTVVDRIPLGPIAQIAGAHVAITPDGQRAYVTAFNGQVKVVDLPTRTVVGSIPFDASFANGNNGALDIEIDRQGAFAYVLGYDTVNVINLATDTVTTTLPIGIQLSGVAVAPGGDFLYVTTLYQSLPDLPKNEVVRIDTNGFTIRDRFVVGGLPIGLVVRPGM
jgi:YVTN family beta-propeller protein